MQISNTQSSGESNWPGLADSCPGINFVESYMRASTQCACKVVKMVAHDCKTQNIMRVLTN